ncbi:MAG: aromatic-ring-hydroxylating dioxygenase subunit beta [Burkholderiaceae bacterium]
METASVNGLGRQEVEDFLIRETALLDEWRLEEWLQLVEVGGKYLVPSLTVLKGDPDQALFLVADDYTSLKSRVAQLIGRSTWAETPRSRTRHFVSNVRILGVQDDVATVTANFTVWRFQMGASDPYVGKYVHKIVRTPAGLKFRERRCELDLEHLRPHGKLSIIL